MIKSTIERILVSKVFDSQTGVATLSSSILASSVICGFNPGSLALAGQLYAASSGNLTAAIGEVVQLVLVNPTGSGRTLQLVSANFATGTPYLYEVGDYSLLKNPPVTSLSPVMVSNTNMASPSVSVSKVYAGVTANLAGTVMTHEMIFSYLVYRDYLRGSWVIPPGTALGLALQLTADGGEVTLTVTWAEIP